MRLIIKRKILHLPVFLDRLDAMAVKTVSTRTPVTPTSDPISKRDEQIRRALNAAQYKKYKETEKQLRATITKEEPDDLRSVQRGSGELDL